MRILIAEDSHIIKLVHKALMDAWGFHYDIVSNGEEAVDYARKTGGNYDLGIMDVSMPVMNGIEATKIIRKETRYFPILGYSSDVEARRKCFDAGMDEFVLKPCSSVGLLTIIEKLTVKTILLHINNNTISMLRAMPMNADELKELRELKKKGLTKLKLLGLERTFVVHKSIQNKISHDLIGAGKEVSEFIDRSPDEPGRCHLYKANLYVTKDLFLPEELEKAIKQEDEAASKYDHIADKKEGYE